MPKIVKEVLIDASPEVIWTLMVQHLKYPEREGERGPEWDKLVIKNIKGEALTSNRTGIGVRTRWYYRFYSYTFKWGDEVTEWKESEKIGWKSISAWDIVDSFTVKPVNKKTRLVYEMNYMPPYGVLGKILYRLFVHKHIEENLKYTLQQMKRSAEATAKFKRSPKKSSLVTT